MFNVFVDTRVVMKNVTSIKQIVIDTSTLNDDNIRETMDTNDDIPFTLRVILDLEKYKDHYVDTEYVSINELKNKDTSTSSSILQPILIAEDENDGLNETELKSSSKEDKKKKKKKRRKSTSTGNKEVDDLGSSSIGSVSLVKQTEGKPSKKRKRVDSIHNESKLDDKQHKKHKHKKHKKNKDKKKKKRKHNTDNDEIKLLQVHVKDSSITSTTSQKKKYITNDDMADEYDVNVSNKEVMDPSLIPTTTTIQDNEYQEPCKLKSFIHTDWLYFECESIPQSRQEFIEKSHSHSYVLNPQIDSKVVYPSHMESSNEMEIHEIDDDNEEEEVVEGDEYPPIITIPKRIYNTLTESPEVGEWYVFLMCHPLKGLKKDTNIGYSKNPIYSVHQHNTIPLFDKETMAAAPYWRLDCVLGPFISISTVIECAKSWVTKTRGIPSKREKAKTLSKLFNTNLYTIDVKLDVPFGQFLMEKNAPLHYIDTYHDLIKEKGGVASSKGTKL